MNSREIVQRTLDFDHPERVARSFDGADIISVKASVKTYASEWEESGDGEWERADEWGNLWARLDTASKGQVVKGVLESLSAMESYEFPDYARPEDYACVASKRADHPDKWLMGSLPGFAFSIARKYRSSR